MESGLAVESEYDRVDALVSGAGLPLDDIERSRGSQYVLRDGDAVVATAALEIRGNNAVLRSVAVAPEYRGRRLGEEIVRVAITAGRERGLTGLYLLTETAENFFPRFGFVVQGRDEAPAAIRESVEYRTVCGSHAVPMTLALGADG